MEFHFVARGFRKQWAMFFESFSNAVKRPFANSLFTDLRQITLRLDSGLATTSRRRNGLTVMRIRYVTCRKDTGNTRAGCAVDRHDIAYLVGLHPRFEYIRIGFMADCQEESSPLRFTKWAPSTPFSPNRPIVLCSKSTVILGLFNTRSCITLEARR